MLFEDVETLNEMIDLIRSGADNHRYVPSLSPSQNNNKDNNNNNKTRTSRRFRDLNDPEIDRLYSTSPPESEQVGTFELDNSLLSDFQNDGEVVAKEREESSSAPSSSSDTKSKSQISADIRSEYRDPLKVFRKQPTHSPSPPSLGATGATTTATAAGAGAGAASVAAVSVSGLSLLLNSDSGDAGAGGGAKRAGGASSGSAGGSGGGSGGMDLTIYLPNRQPLQASVDPGGTVDAAIKSILLTHQRGQEEGEEGSSRLQLHHHAPECYDLRLHEGDGEPDEDFPALDRKRILKQFGNVSEYCLCRKNGVPVPPAPAATDSQANTGKSASTEDSLPADMIIVLLPSAGHVKLRLEPSTTSQGLVALIAKTHRLKLYTVDYICCMTEEDQRRLQFFSPILDPNVPILSFGIKKVELQQRVYADSSRLKALKRMTNQDEADKHDPLAMSKLDSSLLYTDITAAVYQEWNVIKKNKFGRMQERILGIDGSHMYNSRRLGLGRGTKSGDVSHALRDISTVVRVQTVQGDPNSFRVTFDDDSESQVYDIGYTCESSRECFEIIAKLRYLLSVRS